MHGIFSTYYNYFISLVTSSFLLSQYTLSLPVAEWKKPGGIKKQEFSTQQDQVKKETLLLLSGTIL